MQGGWENLEIIMPYTPLLVSSSSLITHSAYLRSNSAKLSRQRMSAPDASSAAGGEAPGVSTATAGCACTGVFAAATTVASALTMRRRPLLAAGAGPGRSSGVLGGIGRKVGETLNAQALSLADEADWPQSLLCEADHGPPCRRKSQPM